MSSEPSLFDRRRFSRSPAELGQGSERAATTPADPRPPWAPPIARDEASEEPEAGSPVPAELPDVDVVETVPDTERGVAEVIGPPPVAKVGRPDRNGIPGPESPLQIQLADWRRRVFDLYAEIREVAREDPERAWTRWREVREVLYRRHPMSPLQEERREAFRASHFPYDPNLRFEVPVRPDPFGRGHDVAGPSSAVFLPNSGPEMLSFDRVGWIDVPLPSGIERLSLFWLTGYGGGLFLPFRDGTNGTETYGAGRYVLDTPKGADLGAGTLPGTLIIDFNFAYQPSCAFDPRWACPLAPPENRLERPIRAGERL